MMNYRALTGFFLRFSLGAIFLYFGIQAILDPNTAMSYIPAYAEAIFANSTFILIWGIVEVLVGIALIVGVYVKYTSLIAAALLVPIIISVGLNEVAYRDVVILLAAVHLAFEPAYLWSVKGQ